MDKNEDDDVDTVNERNDDASVDKVNEINKPAQQYTRVRGQTITTTTTTTITTTTTTNTITTTTTTLVQPGLVKGSDLMQTVQDVSLYLSW